MPSLMFNKPTNKVLPFNYQITTEAFNNQLYVNAVANGLPFEKISSPLNIKELDSKEKR